MRTWTIDAFGSRYEVRPMPSRPFRAVKVYRDGRNTFAINAKGHIFASSVKGQQKYYTKLDNNTLSILEGLAALGLLPKPDVAKLRAAREADRKADNDSYLAEQIQDNARELGIALNIAQRRTLKSLQARKP